MYLSDNSQGDVVEALNSTSRYLDDLLNIDNLYFEQMVCQIYPTEFYVRYIPQNFSYKRDVFYVRRMVDLIKTAKVNEYIMHIFENIELLSIHATLNYFKMHYFNAF